MEGLDSRIKVGCVATCSYGILAIVTKIRKDRLEGINLNGMPWTSTKPKFVAPNINFYFLSRLQKAADQANVLREVVMDAFDVCSDYY